MCGRFTLRTPPSVLLEHFRVSSLPPFGPRYNVAPTQQVGVVRESTPGQREFVWMQWGLVPRWAKDPKISSQLINARSETAATKPAFRDAFRRRRCLIAADGFYEWQKIGPKSKQPYFIHRKDDRPFAFAGLWERWGELESCTVLTTTPNELCSGFHDRMPVILDPADYSPWLDASVKEPAELQPLLAPYPADELVADQVGQKVNNARYDAEDCLAAERLLF